MTFWVVVNNEIATQLRCLAMTAFLL